ncbi:MAG TPA: alpha/beta hydrolase [Acidimicrobiales bacterium]|nr:alpha/beta hydrolase [Acidimicrobiales bacterium]
MASTRAEPPNDHLVWKSTEVDGRTALYGVAGEGQPLVFLHGWGLGQHSYKRALKRLVHLGCKVFAPALPGFGGSAELPKERFTLEGYGRWVEGFLDAVGLGADEPDFLVGHSFGGAVSIQFAHDHQERVRTLVLINSVGGSAWSKPGPGGAVKSMAQRPLWDWGLHFPSDILPIPHLTRVLPVILEDALPNLLRNPRALWKAANLARRADLTVELEELRRRHLPVVVLWGEQDRIIPRASFDALCAAIGSEGEVVSGNHSWLLADPEAFGEVMTNVVAVADVAREAEAAKPRRGSRRPRQLPALPGAKPGDELSA